MSYLASLLCRNRFCLVGAPDDGVLPLTSLVSLSLSMSSTDSLDPDLAFTCNTTQHKRMLCRPIMF